MNAKDMEALQSKMIHPNNHIINRLFKEIYCIYRKS